MDWTERIGLILCMGMYFCLLFAVAPPGAVPGDGSELTYGMEKLGLVHPPGYPLYVLLGHAFFLMGAVSASLAASAFSALFAVLSLSVLYLLLRRRRITVSSSVLTVALLGVAYPIWDVSVKPEVYTLAAFLFLSTVYAWDTVLRDGDGRLVLWGLAGLSLTHHPLGVLNALLACHATWRTLPTFRLREGLALVLPLGLFAVLFSTSNQPFNWPVVATWGELFDHVLGGTFSRFFFVEGLVTPVVQLGRMFLAHLVAFPLFVLLFVAFGYWSLHREMLPLVGLQLLLLVGVSAYGVPDIHDFLFPSYVVGAVALACGLDRFREVGLRSNLDAIVLVILSYGALIYVTGGGFRYNWQNYSYPKQYVQSVDDEIARGTVLSDWSHYALLRYHQLTESALSNVHLLSPTHRFERWPDIITFHKRHNQPIYTTIRNWNPPDSLELGSRGPVFEVTITGNE